MQISQSKKHKLSHESFVFLFLGDSKVCEGRRMIYPERDKQSENTSSSSFTSLVCHDTI